MSTLRATNIKNPDSGSNNIVLSAGGGVVISGVTTASSFVGNITGTATGLSGTPNIVLGIATVSAGSTAAPSITPTGDSNTGIFFPSADTIAFAEGGAESARFDSSGRLLVGTSTGIVGTNVNIYSGSSTASYLTLAGNAGASPLYIGQDSSGLSRIFQDGNKDITFWTGSAATERMRIASDGSVFIAKTGYGLGTVGVELQSNGQSYFTRSSSQVIIANRLSTDGDVIGIYQDTVQEGTISVSGSTVSYNGAHLSRWSQLPGGEERIEILRGTVLSNIDEMCEWGDEENEQLNRMKVSDVEGDPRVSGVFQSWDDDDDTYTEDFHCAMTGDFIIRIAEGVTVKNGDLLMSAGDGTAKPQDDDIIRSKTIAKVTSTHVTCTYDDGSYCVPCVLMAC